MKLQPDLRASLVGLPKDEPGISKAERERLSAQFESLLVHELVKSMRASVSSSDDFGVSMSMDMMDQSLSEVVSGRLGLGEHLLRQLSSSSQDTGEINRPLPARRAFAVPSLVKPPPSTRSARLPDLQQINAVHARPADALPVDGVVSSPYGTRIDPMLGTHKEHHGIDIAAEQGQEIYAVRSGTVVFAGTKGGYGKTVELRHKDGTITRYAHAHKIHVRVGDRIAQGECVADVGSTGRSTGPHLHFEVRKYGRPVDPMQYLKQDPSTP